MHTKSSRFPSALLLLLAISAPVCAQSSGTPCVVQVIKPNPGQEAGSHVDVEGTAELPPDHHVWVFARHESFRGSDEWWPQNEGRVSPENGKWNVRAVLGGPQDVGDDFDVAVAVFTPGQHRQLRDFLRKGRETGNYPPIEMPDAACPPVLRVVRKTSNN
ncbi:MAG TPA: hypothetical protein VKM72_23700 [Thermoanaerobaculia bacterium]|nr:hypothetical protein [Thermoanaerobaculia bacterium]